MSDGLPLGAQAPARAQIPSGLTPGRRTLALTVLMALAGTALAAVASRWGAPSRTSMPVAWWVLMLAVVLADALVFHIEWSGEAHTISLGSLPLVVGYFFAPAWIVVVCRVAGGTIYQVLRWRQRGMKLAFNSADFALNAGVLVWLMHLLVGAGPLGSLTTWTFTVVSVGGSELAMMVCVATVIEWHGGRAGSRPLLASITAATAVAGASLGLLGAYLLKTGPALLVSLAVVLGATFLAYRRYFEVSKRYAGLQLLYDFTRTVSGVHADAVLDEILTGARHMLQAESAEVILFGPDGAPSLRRRSTKTGDENQLAPPELVRLRSMMSERDSAVLIGDYTSSGARDLIGRPSTGDMIVAPLRSDDEIIGALLVANRLGNVSNFVEEDRRLFETLANHANVALHNSRLMLELRREAEERRREAEERRHQALHDALTALPNRTLFTQRIDEVMAEGRRAAVMLMDLDRFKEVNDTLGHHYGDLLLKEVALRIATSVGEADIAARLGGDEFAVLVADVDACDAEQVARRILEALAGRFRVEELHLDVGVSLGIAMAPGDGGDAVTLLQKADVAMYQAKSAHSGMTRYVPERDSNTPRRLALAGGLRRAIEESELIVQYQPKARVADGRTTGFEALVRWEHPDLGLVMPDEFIPLAEQTGLERQLTQYVLGQALRQCGEWQRRGACVGVAVNLAVRSLLDPQLPEAVALAVAESGLAPGYLTLEITESSVMADPERAITVLAQLAGMGVHLSVDDFGTGYSSLAYLQRLPVTEVKVDKSFVIGMGTNSSDEIIVDSIVQLGHKLGLHVIAEGVEDEDILGRLRAMGCDLYQGWHLARPMPADVATRWLTSCRGSQPEAAPSAAATAVSSTV